VLRGKLGIDLVLYSYIEVTHVGVADLVLIIIAIALLSLFTL